MTFDPITRHLTYSPRSRSAAGADKVMLAVLKEISGATDPLSIREVTAAMGGMGHSKGSIESALKKASDPMRGYLYRVKGPKGALLHSITAAGQSYLASEGQIAIIDDGAPLDSFK